MNNSTLEIFFQIEIRIANVAVIKCHQWLDEIRIIFPALANEISLSCFQKTVMQYTPLTLDTIQFAQHTLARLLQMRMFHAARGEIPLTLSNICYCRVSGSWKFVTLKTHNSTYHGKH